MDITADFILTDCQKPLQTNIYPQPTQAPKLTQEATKYQQTNSKL